ETKPNTEIFRLLAARLGLDDACFKQSDAELLDEVLANAPIDAAALRSRGWAKVDIGQGTTPHAEGRFPTADGRMTIRADDLVALGLDPLPTFDPPAEATDDTLAARF